MLYESIVSSLGISRAPGFMRLSAEDYVPNNPISALVNGVYLKAGKSQKLSYSLELLHPNFDQYGS